MADDEPHIRWLIEQTLEDLVDDGVRLVSVGDGQTALETIKEHHPQLAILTAKGQEYDRQRGGQVGANLYLTKPFDPDELLATAREVLGPSPQRLR